MRSTGTVLLCCLGCRPATPGASDGPTDPPTALPAIEITALEPCEPSDPSDPLPSYERLALAYEPQDIAYLWGGGTSVGDVDGDGDKDVILQASFRPVLYRNPDWQPEGILEPQAQPGAPSSTVLVDIDADGDLDLFLGYYGPRDRLLLNDGTGHFEDATAIRLPGGHRGLTTAASFADVDGDGDLDGLVLSMGGVLELPDARFSDYPPPRDAHLWINNGHGVFEDIGGTLPEQVHSGFTLAGGLHDLDRDGNVDLLAMNDFGPIFGGNQWLLGNGDGTFRTPPAGHGLGFATSAMGLAVGDINEDGFDDLAVPHFGGVSVHESAVTLDGIAWFDTTALHIGEQLGSLDVAWGGSLADIDNDGDVDLQVSAGRLDSVIYANRHQQQNRLYLNTGPGVWPEISVQVGLDLTDQSRGGIFSDLDGNGSLDFVQASLDAPGIHFASCSPNGSLQVALRQPGPNPRAIGAVLTLLDGPPQTQTLRAGGTSFASSAPAEAHFGLGTLETATVRIDWPDGMSTTIEDLPARSAVTIHRDRLDPEP